MQYLTSAWEHGYIEMKEFIAAHEKFDDLKKDFLQKLDDKFYKSMLGSYLNKSDSIQVKTAYFTGIICQYKCSELCGRIKRKDDYLDILVELAKKKNYQSGISRIEELRSDN